CALDEDGAIDTGHAFMRLRDLFQYRRRFFGGVGIERDHHTARIALQNGDNNFRSNPQCFTDERVFGEADGVRKIDIDVCAESSFKLTGLAALSRLRKRGRYRSIWR